MSSSTTLATALQAHYEEMVQYIQGRFSRHDFARDVIHEVWIQLLQGPQQQPIRRPLAFLRKVSLHRALDVCRAKEVRDAHLCSLDDQPDVAVHDGDGAYLLELKRHVQALVVIIEALPPRPRQCFQLHCIHGMEQADIAREIGISHNAVSQHVRVARQRICAAWPAAARYLQRSPVADASARPVATSDDPGASSEPGR